MHIDPTGKKLAVLEQLYRLYDDAVSTTDAACSQGCAACCTCNVTMTSLESLFLYNYLVRENRLDLIDAVQDRCPERRYHPGVTINEFAHRCMYHKEVPEEENDPSWGACPLLLDNACQVYPARPFGCRSMISKNRCTRGSQACMDDVTLTINTVFMQYIEHLDSGGTSGNLSDMLADAAGRSALPGGIQTITNVPAPALMVPPVHQGRLQPLLKNLSACVSGT